MAEAEAGLASSPCSSHLLELWRAQGVVDFLAARREALPARQEGQQPLLHLGIAQDGSHHLRGAHAGQVHCSEEGGEGVSGIIIIISYMIRLRWFSVIQDILKQKGSVGAN